MKGKLFEIRNGNCMVTLYQNGTRIVETVDPSEDFIDLEQPLSLDINISNRCSNGCKYCYAGNTPSGNVADLSKMNYLKGVKGIEIAINIQFPLPDGFETWLQKMKDQGIVVSGTISQIDFERDRNIIKYLRDLQDRGLLHGLGISYRDYNPELEDLIAHTLKDVVIHTIVGVTPPAVVMRLLGRGFKVLILGYKQKERGIDYFKNVDIETWKQGIDNILRFRHSSVLSFDTSAVNQLCLKEKIPAKEWDLYYQGDEGSISFYIDAVNNTFNTDSHTDQVPYDIMKLWQDEGPVEHVIQEDRYLTIKEMFAIIKNKARGDE